MKNIRLFIPVLCLLIAGCGSTKKEFEPAYIKVTNERAQKIVDEMNLENSDKKLVVRDLIANQYRNLSWIQDGRDRKIEEIKKGSLSKDEKDKKIENFKKEADEEISKLHQKYVKNLEKNLTDEQVVAVKDGMTYGVVPITYGGYLDMLPNLSQEEKDTIRGYLIEAREHAMNGGSSDEKHWWFGKYKGKINNYLSERGYDLNQASKDWHKRLEERKENSQGQ